VAGEQVRAFPTKATETIVRGPSGVRTFLIADIRGYTLYTQDHGDEAAARLAARFAELAREGVAVGGGSLIELRGDEALAVFESPREALRAAVQLQVRFVDATVVDPTLPLAVGIGVDAGEAVPVDGGYRGGALNLAARLCSAAGPGEVLASREVVHLARKIEGLKYVDRGPVRFKGLADPVQVVRVRPETEDLAQDTAYRRALGSVAALLAATATSVESRNPYKGLRPFEEADAVDYFGREALTQHLIGHLRDTRFLAVVGPSGCGKSSVIRAGLIPALRSGAIPGSQGWRFADMFPGAYPLAELEATLLRVAENPPPSLIEQLESGESGLLRAVKRVLPADDSELVLVIDQLEEVFTLVGDEDRRTQFLALFQQPTTDPRSRLRVVVTLRADFYDRPLLYPGFAELLRDSVEAVVPLATDELERAIARPAEGAGASLEEGLLSEMVADVANEPGALPLLQYALTELFERREANTLTRTAYRAIGGASGALAGRAEALYRELPEEGKEAAHQLFLRLVGLGEGTEDTRRRVDRREIDSIEVDQAAMREAVDAFGTSRLISFDRDPTTGSPTVEVAHEALLREWRRLRYWIDAARDDVRTHRRLAAAATEWDDSGRDPSFLLRGAHLAQIESWQVGSGLAMAILERDYVGASVEEGHAAAAAERARVAREAAVEQRSLNRRRALVAVLGIAALVAALLTVLAFRESSHSKHEAQIATGRALTANSVANLTVDPERSILLALRAIETFQSTAKNAPREAVEALHRAVESSRATLTLSAPATKYVAFSPDGRVLATAGAATSSQHGGEAILWDARTGRRLLTFPRQSQLVGPDVRFNRDGSRLYTIIGGRGTVAWDTHTGRQVLLLPDKSQINNIALSPGDTHLATTGSDGNLKIWNLRTGRRMLTIRAPSSLCGTAFSPSGATIAAALCFGQEGGADVWDARTGKKLLTLGGPKYGWGFNVGYSPDGTRIVSAGQDGKARVWDAHSGRLLATLIGHTGWIWAARFSPDGGRIATSSSDGTARIWDVRGGRQLLVLAGHTKNVFDVAFSPDGTRVLTGSVDGTARVWDVRPQGARDAATLPAQSGVQGAQVSNYSPDGKLLAVGGGGQISASLWDPKTGKKLRNLPHHGDVFAAAFSPDGTRVVLSGYGAPVVVRTASGRAVLKLRSSGTGFQPGAAWSPDGKLIALGLASTPSGAGLWNADTGKLVRRFADPAGASAVAFSPDGKLFAAGSFGGTASIWDLASPQKERRLQGSVGDSVTDIAFSPDSSKLATSSLNGTATIWGVRSGRSLETIQGQSGALWGVAFSPDGKVLATAGDDTTARLWDVATGKEILTLTGATFALRHLAFSPDGTRLATASGDGTVHIYVLPLDALMNLARSRLTRGWQAIECQQYLHTRICPRTP
jgi:WD40 repeat protein/class 3 adenylate cyclase